LQFQRLGILRIFGISAVHSGRFAGVVAQKRRRATHAPRRTPEKEKAATQRAAAKAGIREERRKS
jgi:hypothetical protein